MISYSSLGLEGSSPLLEMKHSKYHRGYFSLCGIIIRPAVLGEAGEPTGSKLFYLAQMEFTGCYVPAQLQTKTIPNFMLEFVEKLGERASKRP
mmetsp:Transcript_33643/g.24665  ORF Transcript_33643/g.24665 Transcript_33643/m.24665 type:complete len:93 (+) Transcript_33643:685-963(+)